MVVTFLTIKQCITTKLSNYDKVEEIIFQKYFKKSSFETQKKYFRKIPREYFRHISARFHARREGATVFGSHLPNSSLLN